MMLPRGIAPASARRMAIPAQGIWARVTRHTRIAACVFGLVFLVYLCLLPGVLRTWQLTGDEPHYLSIAESLYRDRDLDLANNYGDGVPDPHVSITASGAWRPAHGIGLPLLLALPYGIGDRLGVTLFMNAVAALLAANVYLLGVELSGDTRVGLIAAALVALTPPGAAYAYLVYPEILGALLAVWCYRRIYWSRPALSGYVALGVALSYMPWLVIRFAPLSALLAGTAFYSILGRRHVGGWTKLGRVLALAGPGLVSGSLYVLYQMHLYNALSPLAVYTSTGASIGLPRPEQVLDSSVAWLFDQRVGLLPHAPIFFLAPLGFVFLARQQDRQGWGLIMCALVHSVLAIGSTGFWVQWAPPTRYLIAIVPFACIGVAYALCHVRLSVALVVCVPLLVVCLANLWITFALPGSLYNESHTRAKLWAVYDGWLPADATRLVPVHGSMRAYKDKRYPDNQNRVRYFPGVEALVTEGGRLVPDPDASHGHATCADPADTSPGRLLYARTSSPAVEGRYTYAARLRTRAADGATGPQLAAGLEVWSIPDGSAEPQRLAQRGIHTGVDVDETYQWVSLSIENPRDQVLEFRVVYYANVGLFVDHVRVTHHPVWWSSWGLSLVWGGVIVGLSILLYLYRRPSLPTGHGTVPIGRAAYVVLAGVLVGLVAVAAYGLARLHHYHYDAIHLFRQIGHVSPDPEAESGMAVVSHLEDPPGALVYGPYVRFSPGTYQVTYRLKLAEPDTPGRVVLLDIATDVGSTILAAREIDSDDFDVLGTYQEFALPLVVSEPRTLEFRVHTLGPAELWVDSIRVAPAGG